MVANMSLNTPKNSIVELLPQMYRNLIPEDLVRPLEAEKNATCHDCAMCDRGERTVSQDKVFFKPDIKCCTFHPNLPNYAVGGLLTDESPTVSDGRNRILRKIESRTGVYPHGIDMPKLYTVIYDALEHEQRLGRARTMLCPYFRADNGQCTVWAYRESVCTTWFCKHTRGQDGKLFWDALKEYLRHLEQTLSEYALLEMGWDGTKDLYRRTRSGKARLNERDVDGLAPSDSEYEARWGKWLGREQEFYCKTYDIVQRLSPSDVSRLGGVRLTALSTSLRDRYDRMEKPIVPEFLARNPQLRVSRDGDGHYHLIGYSAYDPVRISPQVYDLLELFDGHKPNNHVMAQIGEQHNVQVSKQLLERMYQHRILVDAQPSTGAHSAEA
jgi:hypothetical protein